MPRTSKTKKRFEVGPHDQKAYVTETGKFGSNLGGGRAAKIEITFLVKFIEKPEVIVGIDHVQMAQNGINAAAANISQLTVSTTGFTALFLADDPALPAIIHNANFVYSASGSIKERLMKRRIRKK